MHIESENDEIEIGVFVEDAWQYRGIGRLLVERLAAEALDMGTEAFTCASLWENHPDGTVRGDEDLGELACRLS